MLLEEMERCNSCVYWACDEECWPENCDVCELPEVSKDGTLYRDTCDVCHAYIMIPMHARDHNNLIACKRCGNLPYGDQDQMLEDLLKNYQGVFIEDGDEWWNDPF